MTRDGDLVDYQLFVGVGAGTRGKGPGGGRNLEKRGCGKGRKRLNKWKMGNMENLASSRIEKQD